jgi:hypothetical protein
MARAKYECRKCKRIWEAMTPKAAKLAIGRPILCDCDEPGYFIELIEVRLDQLTVKTAAEVVKHEVQWAEDDYHANILMGARALGGSPDYRYHTQWASGATLWHHVNGQNSKTVLWEDGEGWVVKG